MSEERTFYEEGDPNAPPPKKFQMTFDGKVVLDEGAMRGDIQKIREDLQNDMVLKSLDKGDYPWVHADGLLGPDEVYATKKHVFLYQIGSELGLTAAQAEEELTMEHLSEIAGDQQISFPVECSQDLAESQSPGSAVVMVYDNAVKGKKVINEKIVLNRSGMPHQPSFETRLFRVTRGDDESWYTYNKSGELKPYSGKVLVSEKNQDVSRTSENQIPFLELRENGPGLENILIKVSVQDFKKDLLSDTGLQETEIQRIDIPQMDMSQGGLVRVQLRNGSYEWFFCPRQMFGYQDENSVLLRHLAERRAAREGDSSVKQPGVGKRILGRIKGLLGWS